MEKLKPIKSGDGFTLMEVIITLAILSIVTIALFRFIDFGLVQFDAGVDMRDEQSNIRTTAYRIVSEVRNVRNVNVYESEAMDDDAIALEKKIYIDSAGQAIYYNDGTTDVLLSRGEIQSLDFSISDVDGKSVLTLELVSSQTGKSIETSVLLNNIIYSDVVSTTGSSIEFDHIAP